MLAEQKNNRASCNICGSASDFIRQELQREGFLCSNCSASSRHRAVVYVLGKCMDTGGMPLVAWPSRKEIRMIESSGRGSYPMMLKEKFEYFNTEYQPNVHIGEQPSNRYADFQQLSFPDRHFDYIIATDVFEHIREDERAFPEVYRVLKDNGIFILTVPYDHAREKTVVRVKTDGDKDIFLLPPEYHGGGGQTLAYRSYGRDLLDRLRECGFSVGCLELEVQRHAIVRQFVFVGVRSSYLDLTKFHSEPIDDVAYEKMQVSPLILFRAFLIVKYNVLSLFHFGSEVLRKLNEKLRKG